MTKCDYCGSTIIFGGKRDANGRFRLGHIHRVGQRFLRTCDCHQFINSRFGS